MRERAQVLTRRVDVGRTGIFVWRELAPDESFEVVFERLMKERPETELRLRKKLLP